MFHSVHTCMCNWIKNIEIIKYCNMYNYAHKYNLIIIIVDVIFLNVVIKLGKEGGGFIDLVITVSRIITSRT